ncbi:hypothetical protein AVEN_198823-1 [Araneus ventricosus]|uniref:Uncharacterized protein n=1 Tax=Araneus ventricosus TaxID=182803 RepID=A0A4Y2HSH8_ARAVE|nr:hypothetical protein AVEN_198823-1 [Araneus ventricosus]
MCFILPATHCACDWPGVESMHCGLRNGGLCDVFLTSPGCLHRLILPDFHRKSARYLLLQEEHSLNDTVHGVDGLVWGGIILGFQNDRISELRDDEPIYRDVILGTTLTFVRGA